MIRLLFVYPVPQFPPLKPVAAALLFLFWVPTSRFALKARLAGGPPSSLVSPSFARDDPGVRVRLFVLVGVFFFFLPYAVFSFFPPTLLLGSIFVDSTQRSPVFLSSGLWFSRLGVGKPSTCPSSTLFLLPGDVKELGLIIMLGGMTSLAVEQ